ncbi:MAG: hypothetical protein ACOVOV_14110, partial [Dolichospermum sp.]
VPPTVVINNSSGVTVALTTPQPRRLIGSSTGTNGKLVLKSGNLSGGAHVRIFSPSTIVRIGGTIGVLPDSLSNLTVNYQNTSTITTGPEFGNLNTTTIGGTVTLGTVNVLINGGSTVNLAATKEASSVSLINGTFDFNSNNLTVNDTLKMAGGSLSLGSSTLTYGSSAVLEYAGTAAQNVGFQEWPSNGALSVPPTVVINNSNNVTIGLASPQPKRLIGSSVGTNGRLVLKNGTLFNSSNARLYSPSTIIRIAGAMSSLPDSLSSLTVNYQNTSPITTGPEFGVVNSTSIGGTVNLGTVSLVVNTPSTVTLAANRQVNGSISLTSGTLDISTFTLTSRGTLSRTNGAITATNGTV